MTNKQKIVKIHAVYIGQNLRNLRIKHRVQADALAKLIGKTRQTYSYYERGLRQIDIEALVTLADYYDVSVDYLMSNPLTMKSTKTIEYRTYEKCDNGTLKDAPNTAISTVYSDVIVVRIDDHTTQLFEKCQVFIEGRIMLFDYRDTLYIAQIHKIGNIGFFYHNDKQIEIKERDFEDLSYLGVFMGELKKDYSLDYFF